MCEVHDLHETEDYNKASRLEDQDRDPEEGIEDRDAAESIAKAILWIEHDPATRPTEKDAWFDHELVGLSVMREGVSVGTISRLEHFPGQDLLVVETPAGEVLLPFVAAFVPQVDVAGGSVTITPPGGLFE